MSASFKVNQPAEFTIQIGLKIHNGTLTVQPHLLPQQTQHQLPMQMPRPLAPAVSPEKNLDNLVRGMNSLSMNSLSMNSLSMNSLSMNNDLVEDSSAPPRIQSPIESQEPPVMLNQTKRRERANQRPCPIGIPNVPDAEGCGKAQRRAMRSAAAQSGAAGHEGLVLIPKAPDGGRPIRAGDSLNKLSRGPVNEEQECRAEVNETLENRGYEIEEDDRNRRRRVASSMQSVYSPIPSGDSSHGSSSPPASYPSVPTPSTVDGSVVSGPVVRPGPALIKSEEPARRRRGRPPKPREEGAPTQPAAPRQSVGKGGQLQPRLPSLGVRESSGGSGLASFIPRSELLEAIRVIQRYTLEELSLRNERGELLYHTLAREGNWAKVVALNIRWQNNASLDDLLTGINAESSMGHTAIIEAVVQQNVKAVKYCCMFACSSDVHLYRALVESAMLKSDIIFNIILQAMCHEVDENGNSMKCANRFIDSPIGGWSFRNPDLSSYAGLTLAQALTVHPSQFHHRLNALINHGADPSRAIGQEAVEKYRAYINCIYLAAAFSPSPYECLVALGIQPEADQPIWWESSGGRTLEWCVKTIDRRLELAFDYREFVHEKLSRPYLEILDADEVDDILHQLFSIK